MKYGARNQITGKVKTVKKGSLMCQVTVSVDRPFEVTSVMTLDSLRDLGLKKGDRVQAVVKAIHVLLVRE
jgi:molybdopterin-binding protein